MIPVLLLNYVMGVILEVVAFLAWFVLVFAARLPEGFYKPIRAALSYQTKANAYVFLLTEEFPPFWMDEHEEQPQLDVPPPASGIPAGTPEGSGAAQ